ncbi:hypothetical protein NP233_g11621 [Leucocoprinus birnbaumii]|uniref:HMG box domain-containing protein n=1 Tax=Leucocoprinus birnbaumii TaxID=56174 RepID=A0AAD5YQS1_9AGAR|nr:hypothetical protein NP233_g11621 [Leucocoprinus birnbaumii]
MARRPKLVIPPEIKSSSVGGEFQGGHVEDGDESASKAFGSSEHECGGAMKGSGEGVMNVYFHFWVAFPGRSPPDQGLVVILDLVSLPTERPASSASLASPTQSAIPCSFFPSIVVDMPAERTRGSRRTESDGEIKFGKPARVDPPTRKLPPGKQLVWTMPVEPTDPSGVSFTPNVTPVSFNEGPVSSPDSPASENVMFPPTDDNSSGPRRPAHSKKKPENHIPRPPNAFILFRSSFIKQQHVSTEVETNHSTLSKIIGLTWQNLPEKERQVWHAKAKAALEEHKRKFPQLER